MTGRMLTGLPVSDRVVVDDNTPADTGPAQTKVMSAMVGTQEQTYEILSDGRNPA